MYLDIMDLWQFNQKIYQQQQQQHLLSSYSSYLFKLPTSGGAFILVSVRISSIIVPSSIIYSLGLIFDIIYSYS